jgi:hypothetical protein
VPEVRPQLRRGHLLQRAALSLLVIVAAYAGVWGYFQWKAQKVRAEVEKKLEPLFKESDELASLKDVDLDPRSLTLAQLEEKFQQPSQKLAGAKNTTKLGWLCGNDQCAIWASFLAPFGQEVPANAAPVLLLVDSPFMQPPHHLAVGGIYLGESSADIQKFCQTRGYDLEKGKNRMNWDKDWSVAWAERDDKISLIVFANQKALHDVKAGAAVPAAKSLGRWVKSNTQSTSS